MEIKEHPDSPAGVLECWFEFGSSYSYLSVMRIEELARASGVVFAWKPFLLGPIFRELGRSSSPFVLRPEKGRYMWRDMEREARKYRLAFNKPSVFPRTAVLPARVALFGAGQSWAGAFCRAVMQQNWGEDLDIDDAGQVRRALDGLVPDPDAVIRQAQAEGNKLRLRQQTEEMRRRGIFGAPAFLVDDDIFWSNDRLDDALAAASAARHRATATHGAWRPMEGAAK